MERNYPGLFITFEGPECCGKGVHSEWLKNTLGELGYTTCLTREPGGTSVGEEVRTILKSHPVAMNQVCELMLFGAARAQIVHEVILPHLKAGEVVICDRFYDSTTAYQQHARGIPEALVQQCIQMATSGLRPDLTFLIDLPPQDSLAFARERASRTATTLHDRFDAESAAFYQRVYFGYMQIAQREPDRVKLIPYLRGNLAGMQREMLNNLIPFLQRHQNQ